MENEGKIYYSIREVVTRTGLPIPTLRYWEKRFPQLQPRKDGHGNRYYKEEDIVLIERIRYIRNDLHITRIDAIQRELNLQSNKSDVRAQATEVLKRLKADLEEIRKRI